MNSFAQPQAKPIIGKTLHAFKKAYFIFFRVQVNDSQKATAYLHIQSDQLLLKKWN